VLSSSCNLSPSTTASPHDHSVLCYGLGTVAYSGQDLASILLAEGQDYQPFNPLGKVTIHFLSGLLSPSSETRIHVVRHTSRLGACAIVRERPRDGSGYQCHGPLTKTKNLQGGWACGPMYNTWTRAVRSQALEKR
jgi:hypothetical protein